MSNGAMAWNYSGLSFGLENLRLLSAVLSVSIINHLRLLTPHLAFIRQTKCSIMKTWHEDTFLQVGKIRKKCYLSNIFIFPHISTSQ